MKNWKIRTKILSGFLVVVVAMMILGGYSLNTIDDLSTSKTLLMKESQLLEQHVLELRKHEKDFFLRDLTDPAFFETGTSSSLEKAEKAYRALEAIIEMIRTHNDVVGNGTFTEELDQIDHLLDEYMVRFAKVVEKKHEIGYLTYGKIGELREAVQELEDHSNALNDLELTNLILQARRAEKDYLLRKDTKYATRLEGIVKQINTHVSTMDVSETEKATCIALSNTYAKSFEAVVLLDMEIGLSESEGLIGEYRNAIHDMEPIIAQQAKEIGDMIDQEVEEAYKLVTNLVIGAVILSILIAIAISIAISRPVSRLVAAAETIALGDLTGEIEAKSTDEIGQLTQSFKTMQDNLKDLILNVQSMASQVSTTSEELSSSSEETGAAAEETASSIENLSESASIQSSHMQEVDAFVNTFIGDVESSNEEVRSVNSAATAVSSLAKDGAVTIDKAMKQIDHIQEAARDTEATIVKLQENSEQIGEISAVITAISEQTNLLALNAAIESARAGEHGKGFAVVAEEVRKLASSSEESAQEISQLTKRIQEGIQQTIASTKKSIEEVESGREVILASGDVFNQIEADIQGVAALVASADQSMYNATKVSKDVLLQVDEVTSIIANTSNFTQEVSASAEEQSAMAEEISHRAMDLARMSEELCDMVSTFKVDE